MASLLDSISDSTHMEASYISVKLKRIRLELLEVRCVPTSEKHTVIGLDFSRQSLLKANVSLTLIHTRSTGETLGTILSFPYSNLVILSHPGTDHMGARVWRIHFPNKHFIKSE